MSNKCMRTKYLAGFWLMRKEKVMMVDDQASIMKTNGRASALKKRHGASTVFKWQNETCGEKTLESNYGHQTLHTPGYSTLMKLHVAPYALPLEPYQSSPWSDRGFIEMRFYSVPIVRSRRNSGSTRLNADGPN